jgi:DNA-binding NarL/FixJ family response regulator
LLILDPLLPGLDGIAATRQLAATQPKLKIVALSSRQEALFARALLEAGAQGFLSKTAPGSALVEAVNLVLAGELYVDRSVLEQEAARDALLAAPAPKSAKLSEREEEVLRLLARGLTMKTVSPRLKLSPRTVETYKARAMLKLNLRSRADLLRFAVRCGWLDET